MCNSFDLTSKTETLCFTETHMGTLYCLQFDAYEKYNHCVATGGAEGNPSCSAYC